MLLRHLAIPFSLIPIKSPSHWRDNHTQKSVIFLKIIWLLFMCGSICLMIQQLFDSTTIYLGETQILATSFSKVPVDETFWLCFESTVPIESTTVGFISLMSFAMKRSFGMTPSPKSMQSYEEQIDLSSIKSGKDYIDNLNNNSLFPFNEDTSSLINDVIVVPIAFQTEFHSRQCYNMSRPTNSSIQIKKSSLKYVDSIFVVPVGMTDFSTLEHEEIYNGMIANDAFKLSNTHFDQQYFVTVTRTKFGIGKDGLECKPVVGDIFHNNCMINCRNMYYGSRATCKTFTLRDSHALMNITFCSYANDMFIREKSQKNEVQCIEKCKSLEACQNPKYEFTLSTKRKENLLQHPVEFFKLQLSFGVQQNIHQQLAKNLDDFLADVGGIIGLYFGFSFIGVMHIVFYCVYVYLRTRAKRKFGVVANKFADNQLRKNMLLQMRRVSEIHTPASCDELEDGLHRQRTIDHSCDEVRVIEIIMANRMLIRQLAKESVCEEAD